ncbi:hypothetical protein GGI15_001015 [Coemansia interrupta]|uniref:Kinase n=1 Tax=Coemansia interrupta TaxID=1126814 RepID=A0A9W8HKN2_9FUNG|nr:hypothetical protein GGI15_001015 [Coemansia interrupta]
MVDKVEKPQRSDSAIKSFTHQVAGHGKILRAQDDRMVFKPLNEREHQFYEGAIDHPLFRPFIPDYYGTLQLNGNADERVATDNQARKSSADLYICLENLLYGFENPCIMDVKLGVRLYDIDATPEKIAKMKAKAKERTVSQIGVMIGGISLPGRPAYEHKWLYKLTTDTITPDALVPYFAVAEESVGAEYRRFVIDQFIAEIKEYREVVKKSETRMVGSSLLLVYDASTKKYATFLAGNKSPSASSTISEDGDGALFDVRAIDFAHSHWVRGQGADEEYLFGLDNLIQLLSGLP